MNIRKRKLLQALATRYRQFHETGHLPKRLARRASAPLLVYPHDRWTTAKLKVLMVGQETLTWAYDPHELGTPREPIKTYRDFTETEDAVGAMQELYRWYSLGRRYPKMNSAFWRGFRAFDAALNPTPDSALWTNLFKVNVSGSVVANCNRAEIAKIHKAQQGLLRHEIDTLKPDVLVFFTGPRYDAALKAELGDVTFHPVEGLATHAEPHPAAHLARLEGPGLPTRTLRSYHPEYLQRSRQFSLIEKLARWALTPTDFREPKVRPLRPELR